MKNKNNINVGTDAVVIGNINGNIGNGSVVIDPTDNYGNVILRGPMAIGRNAHAGSNSIAIGANAGSGCDINILLDKVEEVIKSSKDEKNIFIIYELKQEVNKNIKNKQIIKSLWDNIKNLESLLKCGAIIIEITKWVNSLK